MKSVTLAICLTLTLVGCQSFVTASAAANIQFGSTSGTLDTLGYLHIFGEVENIGIQSFKYVEITGTFYDLDHIVIATEYTFTKLDQVEPGQKSPFDLFIMNANTSAQVTSYHLSVTADATNAKPQGLQILSHSSSIDDLGYFEIVGEVQNLRNNSASYVEVIGTFYDANGTVIGCDYTFTNPTNLAGGETSPFKMTFMYMPLSSDITSYALTAQSTEYSVLPEFSTGLLLTVLAITTLAVVVYNRKKHANFHTVITELS